MLETFHTHRPLLFGIAYRMLGAVSDAEDILQEIWLRWQRQDATAIVSAKAWLVSATARACIDQLRSARRAREDYYGVWLPEPLMPATDTDPRTTAELSESLSMAFMLLLESLGPTERAVFLLREIFGCDYDEVATVVGKTEANCRQIVRRAKAQLEIAPRSSPPPTAQAQQLVDAFLAATASGDMSRILALITADCAVYSDGGGRVKAAGRPILGADHTSRFLVGIWPKFVDEMERRRVIINGAPGLLMSLGGQVHYAFSFEVAGDRVRALYIHCNPEKLRHLSSAGRGREKAGPA